MKKLSVSIIAHNEAEHLDKCLESISWADEIIVVDCESNDNTVEVARKYTDKIFSRPNLPNLNLNKSFGIGQTKGDWILYLDPDERVSKELKEEILSCIQHPASSINGYLTPRKNHYLGKWLRWGGQYPDRQLRLFKKGKAKFLCEHVHERIQIDGKIATLKGYLEHYPYSTINELLKKLVFYTDFQVGYLRNKGVKPNLFVAWRYLFWRPGTRFFRRYFLKLGFLDGYPGLLACLHDLLTEIFIYFKLWEERKK
ncbi:MAG TPA: glycosyltransferase family 2 protein [Elusimicrobia bacterium]|nr:glycosyltransferase family 2 protein [Elusimicrobiota bacterium]